MEFTRLVSATKQRRNCKQVRRTQRTAVGPSLKRTVCGVQVCGVWGVCTSGGLELNVHMIRAQREVKGDGR